MAWRAGRFLLAAMSVAAALDLAVPQAHAANDDETRTRGEWATLLVGYAALSAATVGGAYLMRDNFVGQGIAVAAASAGGLVVGAGAGYGLGRLRTCETATDCSTDEDVPTLLGGLIGATAAGVAATILTFSRGSSPVRSRPNIAAAGLAPGLVFVGMGTIFCW